MKKFIICLAVLGFAGLTIQNPLSAQIPASGTASHRIVEDGGTGAYPAIILKH